jgi:phenylalanyl-tRNA synthetase alpha chain
MTTSFERIAELRAVAEGEIAAAGSLEALECLKPGLLGKKSGLKALLKGVGGLPAEERPRFGEAVNAAARGVEAAFAARREALSAGGSGPRGFDFTRPGFPVVRGLPHPLVRTRERIETIFRRLGYGVAEGPDIEDDRTNFGDLNFPPDHPARDAQDTFFLAGIGEAKNPLLLRTHTSPVQIRVMTAMAPPLAVIVPGRTYRADAQDATHSPIFHQVEGLVVGEAITLADLKGTLAHFARELFGPGFSVRFRPSFFPFTEPSAEVDVSCVACEGRGDSSCRVCKGTGWLEILGAGMVDPNVFEAVCRRRGDRVYDPERVTGFAFGMGVERIAMLTHGVDDLRLFFENDARFLAMLAS